MQPVRSPDGGNGEAKESKGDCKKGQTVEGKTRAAKAAMSASSERVWADVWFPHKARLLKSVELPPDVTPELARNAGLAQFGPTAHLLFVDFAAKGRMLLSKMLKIVTAEERVQISGAEVHGGGKAHGKEERFSSRLDYIFHVFDKCVVACWFCLLISATHSSSCCCCQVPNPELSPSRRRSVPPAHLARGRTGRQGADAGLHAEYAITLFGRRVLSVPFCFQ
jgi:hypothetical protein